MLSKHRDRNHHVILLIISNNEGKFHYLLIMNMSALVTGRTNYQHHTSVCLIDSSLYCFSEARLLTAHLHDCSAQPEQKVAYPSPDDPEKNIKRFKASTKTLPVPFVLYAEFEAILVPAEEIKERASNTKARHLHQPSLFACLRISQLSELV